jgi:hypothetical protein
MPMKCLSARATRVPSSLPQRVLALAFASVAVAASATDLRGRVEGQNAFQSYPFPVNGTKVELLDAAGQRVLAGYVTGPDGFYYFRGIAPGSYSLRVSGQRYPVNVRSAPAQDIAPVRLRF